MMGYKKLLELTLRLLIMKVLIKTHGLLVMKVSLLQAYLSPLPSLIADPSFYSALPHIPH